MAIRLTDLLDWVRRMCFRCRLMFSYLSESLERQLFAE